MTNTVNVALLALLLAEVVGGNNALDLATLDGLGELEDAEGAGNENEDQSEHLREVDDPMGNRRLSRATHVTRETHRAGVLALVCVDAGLAATVVAPDAAELLSA